MTIADVSRPGAAAASGSPLLRVEDLVVDYEPLDGAPVRAVDGVSFELAAGEFVGLVGESGSGKSTLGFAVTRLQRPPARTVSGRILFEDADIGGVSQPDLRRQRQGGFAMVLQSGMNALNPVRTVRDHFRDVFRAHGHVTRGAWDARTAELVEMVQLGTDVLGRYPGELSGGMRQRVSIALALALEPRLLVFDEPTTALDVLVQRSIMETIARLQREQDFTALLISHDLGVVLEATRRVMVMHEGRIVEDAPSSRILHDPRDAYTRMLLSHYADPRAERVELPGFPARETVSRTDAAARPDGERLVVDGVSKTYPARRRRDAPVHAVRDVSFELAPGAALALVGQSGSGKSTIGAMIAGITAPTAGTVRFGDRDVGALRGAARRQLHRDIQVVFQDPYAALNPVTSVGYAIARPVANHAGLRGEALQARVAELLETVGLTPADSFADKLPHELSGGQRQRVVIARALATNPKVLIADEPVSMLDVTLRAGILALLDDLRRDRGVALLYITHDLLSARLVTDDVLVLHDGAVVERGETAQVLRHPTDEYTVRLLDAIPNPGGRREAE